MNPNPPSNPPPFSPPPPPSAPAAAKKPAGMAITAFVLSFFGCLLVPSVVSFILSLVVLIKDKGGKGLAIAALILSFVSPVMIGIPAAIAIPNFIKFQARAKQAECKSNLKSLYTAERVYFQDHDAYSEDAEQIGFSPEHPHRYSYFLSENRAPLAADNGAVSLSAVPDLGELKVGVQGECPKCQFTAVCAGAITSSGKVDVWAVSTEEQASGEGTAPAGQPFQVANGIDF